MGKTTGIAWADSTFNIAWGCTKVSPGCANCYAETFSNRWDLACWGPTAGRRTFGPKHWSQPINWDKEAERTKTRRRVFCSSMCDVFEDHPTITSERELLWHTIQMTPNLDWLLLTKRAERIESCLPMDWGQTGWPNVWLGGSCLGTRHQGSMRY